MGLFGMDSYMVQVEADLSQGLPRFDIVGLPDAAISEAKNRVRSAIKNTGFAFPVSRITVNLAPADTRKEGSVYDLPILMALLKAGRQINFDSDNMAFIGEVALDGLVRRVDGALPMVITAAKNGIKTVFVPTENAAESSSTSSKARQRERLMTETSVSSSGCRNTASTCWGVFSRLARESSSSDTSVTSVTVEIGRFRESHSEVASKN